jgi:hypothetical protein
MIGKQIIAAVANLPAPSVQVIRTCELVHWLVNAESVSLPLPSLGTWPNKALKTMQRADLVQSLKADTAWKWNHQPLCAHLASSFLGLTADGSVMKARPAPLRHCVRADPTLIRARRPRINL